MLGGRNFDVASIRNFDVASIGVWVRQYMSKYSCRLLYSIAVAAAGGAFVYRKDPYLHKAHITGMIF